MFEPSEHAIFVTLAGSQAHGTARAGSDVDVRGVCVLPLAQRLSLFRTFEKSEAPLTGKLWQIVEGRIRAHPTAQHGLTIGTESVLFELSKFVRLCAAGNPNALEILFADECDWLFESAAWRKLYAARTLFLSRKVERTFLGYALAQLKRIRTHRAWLLQPPSAQPARADFGLPDAGTLNRDDQNRLEQAIAEKVRSYGFEQIELTPFLRDAVEHRIERFWLDANACSPDELAERLRAVATHALGIPAHVVSALNAEKRYLAALKNWESYRTWLAERNEVRAALERAHGYDTKHAMHLLRLLRMGLELLETGELRVRRADAAELGAVRDGALSYDQLLAASAEVEAKIHAAESHSPLPADVDFTAIDALALELMHAHS